MADLVCLTLDDGPSSFRPGTLEVLRELAVPAALFEVGMRVRANPQLTHFAAAEGHQVLNHSYTHPALPSLTAAGVTSEVLRTVDAITDAGAAMSFPGVRPPMLAIDDAVREVLAQLGHVEVGGDVNTPDWHPDTTADQIRDDVLASLHPGAVIILHDGPVDTGAGSATLAALPGLVTGARELGFEFGLLAPDGGVVPATYVSSGLTVRAIEAPVPYRPLMFADPPPPDPWVPILDGAGDPASAVGRLLADLREHGDVAGHLTADVVWTTQGTTERVRGRDAVAELLRELLAQASDLPPDASAVSPDRALVEGALTAPDAAPAAPPTPFAAVLGLAPDGIAAVRLYLATPRPLADA